MKGNIVELLLGKGRALRPEPPKPNSVYIGKPVAYHVSQHVVVCRNCRLYHETSQVMMEVAGPRYKIFRAVGRLDYNLPIIVNHSQAEEIPICASCAPSVSLGHLPPAPEAPKPSPSEVKAKWREEKSKKEKPQSIEDML